MEAASLFGHPYSANSPFHLNARIKSLQNQHKQLEQSLRERVESLSMQINLTPNFVPSTQIGLSTTLTTIILQQHSDMHRRCSDQLLKNQVQIQQQAEIRELVKNYQKRIMDLRSMLVGKEAEIVFDTYQIKRDGIPKRENMQILNNQLTERVAIKKTLDELKRLRVQVNALQHAVKIKVAIGSKKGIPSNDVSFLSCSNAEEEKAFPQRIDPYPLKKRENSYQRNKLLAKVNQVLMEQIAKQERLKQALKSSKSEWQSVRSHHHQLCNKYNSLLMERVKNNMPTSTQNLLLQLENQQDGDDRAKVADLFNAKDLNSIKSTQAKPSSRRNNLKEKRKQRTKQN